jgi:hypothetical protein
MKNTQRASSLIGVTIAFCIVVVTLGFVATSLVSHYYPTQHLETQNNK